MVLPSLTRSTTPISSATRITATAFCVVAISGMPSPTIPLEVRPSSGSRFLTLSARDSFSRRALLTAFARGFTSWSCIFCSTSATSFHESSKAALSLTSVRALSMACARVMVFLLIWYLLVPHGVGLLACSPLTTISILFWLWESRLTGER